MNETGIRFFFDSGKTVDFECKNPKQVLKKLAKVTTPYVSLDYKTAINIRKVTNTEIYVKGEPIEEK